MSSNDEQQRWAVVMSSNDDKMWWEAVLRSSDEERLMCIAEVGFAVEPYECLQEESFTWGLDSSNPSSLEIRKPVWVLLWVFLLFSSVGVDCNREDCCLPCTINKDQITNILISFMW